MEREMRTAGKLGLVILLLAAGANAQQWPSFRGERAAGIGDGQEPPVTWDAEKGVNVLWRTPIPGLGHSSPAVWGDRLFVTTAVAPDHDPYLRPGLYGESPENPEDWVHHYRVYCLDKRTGQVLWERTATSGKPQVRRHVKSSHATPTPATDGRRVVVSFGSEGLYAFDMEGAPLWKVDLGYLDSGAFDVPEIQWGYGSSPVIHGDRVLVLCDLNNQSFIAALDVETGKELWRELREETPTWGTPTVHEAPGRSQVIVNGYRHRGGYDLETGAELWRMSGGGDIPIPTPVVAHGLAFFSSAHGPRSPIIAVRLEADGDISLAEGETSNEFVAWSQAHRGAYLPTPIVYGDLLYVGNDRGILTAYRARTGEQVYRARLAGRRGAYAASPVAAGGRVYFTNEECDTHVVKAGPEYELLATNSLPGVCLASPAISERMFFVRTSTHVWALGQTDERFVLEEAAPAAENAVQRTSATASAESAGKTPVGDLTDAATILEQADAAARAVQTASYRIHVEGTGAAKARFPSLEATILSSGWLQGLPERFRVEGTVQRPGATAPVEFLAGSDGNVYYLVDHAARVVYEDLESRVMGSYRRAAYTSLVSELHHPEPYSEEIASPVRELQGVTEVDGEACYRVRVVYDSEGSNESIWYFSQKDLLPRRRESRFTMGDEGKGGLVHSIRNLVTEPELDPEVFASILPEGYSKRSTPAP